MIENLQFVTEKARQREQALAALAKAKEMEARRKCKTIRIDGRTEILCSDTEDEATTNAKVARYRKSTEPPVRAHREPKKENSKRKLTEEEKNEIRRDYSMVSNTELAERYGVAVTKIQQFACQNKLRKSSVWRSANAREAAEKSRTNIPQK